MRNISTIAFVIVVFSICNLTVKGQTPENKSGKKVYTQSVSDLLFGFSDCVDTANHALKNGVRTTYVFNYGQFLHIDVSNALGFVTGLSVRNVGIKTFDETIQNFEYDKVKRRVFALGGSFAVKAGSFSNHSFVYAGGEYEMAFHYRQKLYAKSSNKLEKQGEWLSSATQRFLPSVFVGYQLPSNFNFQVKYYFDDFLNHSYKGDLGDFTVFKKSQLICLAISYQINKSKGESSILEKLEEKKGTFDL